MAKGNFGERLHREREMREVSVEEITGATRIARRYLEALENEDWSKLPGGVFGRGFVRSIARYLGLDEDSLLGEYDLARKSGLPVAPQPPPRPLPRELPRWLPALIVLLVLLGIAAGAVYGWRRYAARRNAQASAAQATANQPAPAGTASAASADGKSLAPDPEEPPLELSISTSAATRVRILADGTLLLDAELGAGENRRFTAREQFEVTAADSSAVLLELNHQTMPPIGTPGASGTIILSRKDLKQASGGTTQP
jgi:cytoskeleton protein RodZ